MIPGTVVRPLTRLVDERAYLMDYAGDYVPESTLVRGRFFPLPETRFPGTHDDCERGYLREPDASDSCEPSDYVPKRQRLIVGEHSTPFL